MEKDPLADWKEMRTLTLDLLKTLTNEQLGFSIEGQTWQLKEQFHCMGKTEACFRDAITTGSIDFEAHNDDAVGDTKEEIAAYLTQVDQTLAAAIEKNPDATIDWFGEPMSLEKHLNALVQHEVLHQGQLIVYVRVLGIDFPPSWKLWGFTPKS